MNLTAEPLQPLDAAVQTSAIHNKVCAQFRQAKERRLLGRAFFSPTELARYQHARMFDFVWPTAAALWNLRWQVQGYIAVHPDASRKELEARFVEGSGIHGADVGKSRAEWSWEDQTRELATYVLVVAIARFEAWLTDLSAYFTEPQRMSRELQLPSSNSQYSKHASRLGIWDCLERLKQQHPGVAGIGFHQTLSRERHYSAGNLDALVVCYRYFKQLRNILLHKGGIADVRTVEAYDDYRHLTASILGLRELPRQEPVQSGSRVNLSLRGVVGFSGVILRMMRTVDAELALTRQADEYILDRWRSMNGRHVMPAGAQRRAKRLRILAYRAGLPRPRNTDSLEIFLYHNDLTYPRPLSS